MQLAGGISIFERVCGQKADIFADAVNLTIVLSAEPCNEICYAFYKNVTFVSCHKFEL